jgi:hypothetical protein
MGAMESTRATVADAIKKGDHLLMWGGRMTQIQMSVEMHCPHCGYDLRHIDSERCPECGEAIDRSRLGQSIIPWLHRARIGRYRAFWRTVNLVSLRPARLGREMNVPANLPDAQRFRWMVVLHAFVPVVIALFPLARGFYYNSLARLFWVANDPVGSIVQSLIVLAALAAVAIGLFAVTGVAGHFFHPKTLSPTQQTRAVVLSYYAAAPLAYLPITVVLVFAAAIFADKMPRTRMPVLIVAAVALAGIAVMIIQLIVMLRSPLVLLERATHRGIERQIIAGVMLPFLWVITFALFVVVIPGTLMVLSLILFSFRE